MKVLDASWYMPDEQRNPLQEYQVAHIPGALFFDVDGIFDRTINLPHMLPSEEAFVAAVSALGIENKDGVVVYDGKGIFSAVRVWWLVASRATRVEIETRRTELETNLSTNLFRWRQELEAVQQSTFLYISYNFKFNLAGWLGVEEIGLYNFKPSFLSMPEEALQMIVFQDTDQNLSHTLQFGFGLHHAGLNNKDRSFVEEIFANNKIQKCLTYGSPDECQLLVNEMLGSTDENEPLQDPPGTGKTQTILGLLSAILHTNLVS
uniref:Rhodanese domain-containing protein n=1 Tax=Lactuca sativa TaxID=4236 RepID=A0A9R1UWU7_LACSA|nr:hypothetical protein LSAT_V11C800419780 [Lactuca sativa]